nr:hypothetical protein [uncultured Cedecea sp.]
MNFWICNCINCQHRLFQLRDWVNKYQEQGLVVVGVHTPEYPWERDIKAVNCGIK